MENPTIQLDFVILLFLYSPLSLPLSVFLSPHSGFWTLCFTLPFMFPNLRGPPPLDSVILYFDLHSHSADSLRAHLGFWILDSGLVLLAPNLKAT